MGTRSALIQAWGRDGSVRLLYSNSHYSDEMLHHYVVEGFNRLDHWAEVLFHPDRLDRGVARSTEFISTEAHRLTDFYNEFFRRFGDDTGQCLGGGFSFPQDSALGIAVHRAIDEAEFDTNHVTRMQEIAGHVARMMRARDRMHDARLHSDLLEASLDTMGAAIVMLDASGKVNFANAKARELDERSECISLAGGRVMLRSSRENQRLQAAIASRHRVGGSGDAFACCADRGQSWRIHVLPCQRGGVSGCMVIVENGLIPMDMGRRLQLLYGLSPAESRVAMGIAEGQSAAELASTLLVSPATVRTQIRHVFEKTQISKATQLSRLIASLPPVPAV